MNLAELKKIVDDVTTMVDKAGVKCLSNVKVKFKTFDDRFEENSDEYQEPDEITAVDVNILSWNSVTITIERKIENQRMEALHNVTEK
jgi:hypothetical protein